MTTLIRLVLSDVDGTLVGSDKSLATSTVAAVNELRDAGIAFAVTSGRPPRGMAMLIDPLAISTPIGGFNGGLVVDTAMQVLRERRLPADVVAPIIETLRRQGLDVWCYQGIEWLITTLDAPHVAHEQSTCQFPPTVVADYDDLGDDVVKIVGVSDDPATIAAATEAMRVGFAGRVSAAPSQPYYLDVTHPEANKGSVVSFLSSTLDVPIESIATIGDSANDVLMFAHSGLSIAMGNADAGVQRSARMVTSSNDDGGFAHAMRTFVLGAERRLA